MQKMQLELTEASFQYFQKQIQKTIIETTQFLKQLDNSTIITVETENNLNQLLSDFYQLKVYVQFYDQLIRICYFDSTLYPDINPDNIQVFEQYVECNKVKVDQINTLLINTYTQKQEQIKAKRLKDQIATSYNTSLETATQNSTQAMKEIQEAAIKGLKELKLGLKTTTVILDDGDKVADNLQKEVDKASKNSSTTKKQTHIAIKAMRMNQDCFFMTISMVILALVILAFLLA